jgi:hypothetical protein
MDFFTSRADAHKQQVQQPLSSLVYKKILENIQMGGE